MEPRLVARPAVSNELDSICLNFPPQRCVGYAAVQNELSFGMLEDAYIPLIGAHGALVDLATSGVEYLPKLLQEP